MSEGGSQAAVAGQDDQETGEGDGVASWGMEERRLLEALGFIAGGGEGALGRGGEHWGAGLAAGRAALGRVLSVWSEDLPHALVANVRGFVGEVLALRAGGRALERYRWSRVVCPVIWLAASDRGAAIMDGVFAILGMEGVRWVR